MLKTVVKSFFFPAVASGQLRGGSCNVSAALVQQYVNFADNELLPPVCTWTFPTLGIMQYNKQVRSLFKFVARLLFKVPRLSPGVLTDTCFIGHRSCSEQHQGPVGGARQGAGHTHVPCRGASDAGRHLVCVQSAPPLQAGPSEGQKQHLQCQDWPFFVCVGVGAICQGIVRECQQMVHHLYQPATVQECPGGGHPL